MTPPTMAPIFEEDEEEEDEEEEEEEEDSGAGGGDGIGARVLVGALGAGGVYFAGGPGVALLKYGSQFAGTLIVSSSWEVINGKVRFPAHAKP